MEKTCEIVRDLLPLYVDGVCSDASRTLVGEHLAACPECAGEFRKYQKQPFEETIEMEKEGVIAHQVKAMRRTGLLAGSVIGAIFCVPILVCLIVNLATGHALNWFFIVLTSLFVAASLTVVPLAVPRYKGLLTLGSFCASLVLLLATCCIYSGGKWFFMTVSSTLFGLCVVFLPLVVRSGPIAARLGRQKALIVMVADTLLLAVMFLSIGLFVKSGEYARLVTAISVPLVAYVWVIFLTLRYLPVRRCVRWGAAAFLAGTAFAFGEYPVFRLLGQSIPVPGFAPLVWNAETVDGNVSWLVFIAGCVCLLCCLIHAIVKKTKKHELPEEKK